MITPLIISDEYLWNLALINPSSMCAESERMTSRPEKICIVRHDEEKTAESTVVRMQATLAAFPHVYQSPDAIVIAACIQRPLCEYICPSVPIQLHTPKRTA
jgi:hypothetical protein